jgi:beta-glucanase (GH16 family)
VGTLIEPDPVQSCSRTVETASGPCREAGGMGTIRRDTSTERRPAGHYFVMTVTRWLRDRPFFFALLSVASVACSDASSPSPSDGGGGPSEDDASRADAHGSVDTGGAPSDATGGSPDGRGDAPLRPDGPGDPIDVRVGDAARDASTTADANPARDAGAGNDATPGQDAPLRDGAPDPDAVRADAGTSADGGASPDGSRPGWTLVWSDEFNAGSGTGADTTKWNLVNKGDGFGNNELEFYTNRTENAYHDGNGFLVIKAIKESYMGREYTSARLESNGKFERLYGRFEARMQLPRGQGIWPAFWMLGNDIGTVSWPNCGEIDIMENIGKEPTMVHGSLHGPGYSGGNPLGQSYTLPNGQKFADGFHVFAVEWELNVVRFYVDDTLYGTKTPADTPAGARWAYDHPFYLLLNVAVGGTWPGAPDSTTVFPQTLTVDYVRVYSR